MIFSVRGWVLSFWSIEGAQCCLEPIIEWVLGYLVFVDSTKYSLSSGDSMLFYKAPWEVGGFCDKCVSCASIECLRCIFGLIILSEY